MIARCVVDTLSPLYVQLNRLAHSLGLSAYGGILRKGGLPNLVRFDAGAYAEHCRLNAKAISVNRRDKAFPMSPCQPTHCSHSHAVLPLV